MTARPFESATGTTHGVRYAEVTEDGYRLFAYCGFGPDDTFEDVPEHEELDEIDCNRCLSQLSPSTDEDSEA